MSSALALHFVLYYTASILSPIQMPHRQSSLLITIYSTSTHNKNKQFTTMPNDQSKHVHSQIPNPNRNSSISRPRTPSFPHSSLTMVDWPLPLASWDGFKPTPRPPSVFSTSRNLKVGYFLSPWNLRWSYWHSGQLSSPMQCTRINVLHPTGMSRRNRLYKCMEELPATCVSFTDSGFWYCWRWCLFRRGILSQESARQKGWMFCKSYQYLLWRPWEYFLGSKMFRLWFLSLLYPSPKIVHSFLTADILSSVTGTVCRAEIP